MIPDKITSVVVDRIFSLCADNENNHFLQIIAERERERRGEGVEIDIEENRDTCRAQYTRRLVIVGGGSRLP